MEQGKHFTQKQKLVILRSAEEVGVKEAAELAGVHYTTVYDGGSRFFLIARLYLR